VNSARLPQLGSVVWAELEDANGFRKTRPAVVMTASADIAAGKPVRVVAITTRLPKPLPDDHVLLPWDPQGKARSGLRRPCVAVASWHAEVSANVQIVGILPPAVIRELLSKLTGIIQSTGPGASSAANPSVSPPAAPPPAAEKNGE